MDFTRFLTELTVKPCNQIKISTLLFSAPRPLCGGNVQFVLDGDITSHHTMAKMNNAYDSVGTYDKGNTSRPEMRELIS